MAEMLGHMAFEIAGHLGAEWARRYGRAESSGTALRDEMKLLFWELSRVDVGHVLDKGCTCFKGLRGMVSDNTSPAHAVFRPHMGQPLLAGGVDLVRLIAVVEHANVRVEILLHMCSYVLTH
jgi:hypothetical protein